MNFFWLKSPLFDEASGEGGGGGGSTTTTTEKAEQPDYAAQIAALTAERDAEKARSKEHEDAAKFWHGKARGAAEATPAKEAKEEEDSTDLLEVAAKGPKAMKEWMRKQGFVAASDVDQMVSSKATQMQREAAVLAKYPELTDQKGEFFKETAAEFNAMKGQGVPEHIAMELAAERVGMKRGSSSEEGAPVKPRDKEADRVARARAQGGEGTKRQAAKAEESDELSTEQKEIAAKFGITEESYAKRAKAGVQYAARH